MTNQNQIPDDDLLEKWFNNPMTKRNKEELAEYRKEWEQARKDALEHKKNNEYWLFLVSEYWEQGCGRTIFLGMTQKPEERAIRKFKEKFGDYFTQDLCFVTREEFFTNYTEYLPPRLFKAKDALCNVEYFSELHINFS